ncbi:hypothetical protein BFJ69_g499 [Fusarium oxysporum]|uniref:Uncharacterized protein n=1 Tax=Fusarium oxysporum TaxID=5507 RepID=A0A420P5E5_FUSOX|nr:hypothetical protein BFJ69_g499 [Fusarium oxysporum]
MPSLAPIQPRSNPAGQAGSAEPPRPQAVFPKCDPLAPQAAGNLSGKASQSLIPCIYQSLADTLLMYIWIVEIDKWIQRGRCETGACSGTPNL